MKVKAKFHLPGLFEFYDFYKEFLPLFFNHREFFYDWVEIGSIYGAKDGCIWGGGRFEAGEAGEKEVLKLLNEYGISARLTFSNLLLKEEHLNDAKCNRLCALFERNSVTQSGVIVASDLLLTYLKDKFKDIYFVSSTTKVITDHEAFLRELRREEFKYIVPDFRLNKQFDLLASLSASEKEKVEFLCNECCYVGCKDRRSCYENVSRRMLGEEIEEHKCLSPGGEEGYVFSKVMESPSFISLQDIKNIYLQKGFSNFKIEGRGLGSAILLEMLIYYMVKPEYQLKVRENMYLDSMLNLF